MLFSFNCIVFKLLTYPCKKCTYDMMTIYNIQCKPMLLNILNIRGDRSTFTKPIPQKGKIQADKFSSFRFIYFRVLQGCCLDIYSYTLLSHLFHFTVTWTLDCLLNKHKFIRRHQTSTILITQVVHGHDHGFIIKWT